MFYGSIRVETDKSKEIEYRLLNPHYTDSRFNKGQTVFLAQGYRTVSQYGTDMVEGVHYDYSDRLHQWHGEKCDAAWKSAEEKGFAKNSPALLEAYLQALFEDPELQLIHLVTGVNLGNGYPYRVYGYISGKKDEEAVEGEAAE